jgi:hypothetical protein
MTAHIYDELPRLLTGEASREEVLAAADHLRSCIDCQQELVSAVVAHASLTSARRFAPEIVSRMFNGSIAEHESTETSERSRPEQAADNDNPDRPPVTKADFALPDLSAVFAQVRQEAAEPRRTVRSARPARFRYVAGATAAMAAAAAVVITVVVNHNDTPGPVAAQTVQLQPYPSGTTTATARIADGEMTIDAASLPQLAGKRYEVWLTNKARTEMQPLGWLAPNGTAAVTVPPDLMSRFQDVEVSVQDVAAKTYTYSGTSVLRGSID